MTDNRPNVSEVTDEQLAAFGFPVEVTDKVCGSPTVVRPGMKRADAVMEAWAGGFVRMAVTPVPEGKTWAEAFSKPKPRLTADRSILEFFGVSA